MLVLVISEIFVFEEIWYKWNKKETENTTFKTNI